MRYVRGCCCCSHKHTYVKQVTKSQRLSLSFGSLLTENESGALFWLLCFGCWYNTFFRYIFEKSAIWRTSKALIVCFRIFYQQTKTITIAIREKRLSAEICRLKTGLWAKRKQNMAIWKKGKIICIALMVSLLFCCWFARKFATSLRARHSSLPFEAKW